MASNPNPCARARDRRPSGLRLPKSVEGLIQAMQALARGDSQLLEAWNCQRCPILRDAIEAWTRDPLLADRLASRIVKQAFLAVRAGRDRSIWHEIPWMTGVAQRSRAKIRRDERPLGEPLPRAIHASGSGPLDAVIGKEERQRVRDTIAILPEKHRVAVTFRHVNDLAEAEVAWIVERRFRIGFDGTRKLLREGRQMVKLGLEGRDLRALFPGRYAHEKKKTQNPARNRTRRPPFRELHGYRNVAGHCG